MLGMFPRGSSGDGRATRARAPAYVAGAGRQRLGLERVAALLVELAQVRGVEREEPTLGESLLVDPAGVLALVVGAEERAAEEDLAARPAAVALALRFASRALGVLAQEGRLHEAPDLPAQLQRHQRPIGHRRHLSLAGETGILAAPAPAGRQGAARCYTAGRVCAHEPALRSPEPLADRRRRASTSTASRRSRASGRPVALAPAAREAVRRLAPGRGRRGGARGASSTASPPASATSPTSTIPLDRLRELQLNLMRSHAAGVGAAARRRRRPAP